MFYHVEYNIIEEEIIIQEKTLYGVALGFKHMEDWIGSTIYCKVGIKHGHVAITARYGFKFLD